MSGQCGRPRVGIVSDIVLQRHRLQAATAKVGLDVCFSGDPDRLLGYPEFPEAGLWLVTLEDEADHPVLFDHLLENTDAPVLFGLGSGAQTRWYRLFSLGTTVAEQAGGSVRSSGGTRFRSQPGSIGSKGSGQRATGEPAPLDYSPPARTRSLKMSGFWARPWEARRPLSPFSIIYHQDLPVGFVYAQHIDNNFTDVLTRVLGRHAHYKLKRAEEGYCVRNGDVVLMPVDHEWRLDASGALTELNSPWPGPYGPSIDQVLLNVADHYGARCHAILFSGMGNDGAIAAPMLRAYGSRIWVQEHHSCGNSSMPDSVAETGCSTFSGTPKELARELVKTIEESCLLKGRQNRDSA